MKKLNEQAIAAHDLLESWAVSKPYFDIGEHLTCAEVNVLAAFLRAHGYDGDAKDLLESHCHADEAGDDPGHLKLKRTLMR